MELWPFQQKACQNVLDSWRSGSRRVVLVSPTGSGKTEMMSHLAHQAAHRGHPVVWVAHRDELVAQASVALERRIGSLRGITVTSVQTMLARSWRPPARLLVLDEAHHHVADEWGKVAASYSDAAILGGTATPERSDGRPLGNLFDRMVVAATYPELVEGGYLVPCRVFRPGEALSRGLATNPLEAYRKHGEEQKAFVFCPSVKLAREWAETWTQAGIPSEAIDQSTPLDVRRRSIARFSDGGIRALFNVYVLTEGVDIPDCGCVVLARNVGHQTPYLQMVGRALRRAPGKSYGLLIDLPGCSFAHGLPTAHRDYSLEDGITRRKDKEEALRVCLQCGMTHTDEACQRCGFKPEPRKIQRPTIYDMALQEVPNDWAPDKIQQAFALQGPPSVLRARYKKLFGDSPDMKEVPVELKRREWRKLVGQARARQYKIGWASHRFKSVFGFFPPREWLSES